MNETLYMCLKKNILYDCRRDIFSVKSLDIVVHNLQEIRTNLLIAKPLFTSHLQTVDGSIVK